MHFSMISVIRESCLPSTATGGCVSREDKQRLGCELCLLCHKKQFVSQSDTFIPSCISPFVNSQYI